MTPVMAVVRFSAAVERAAPQSTLPKASPMLVSRDSLMDAQSVSCMVSLMLVARSAPPVMSFSRPPSRSIPSIAEETISPISGSSSAMALPRFAMISPMRGMTLLAAVTTDSISSSVRAPMSASSLPSSVTKFCHAALAMLTEPSMVVAASRAVVPLMPCFCCTSSMAATTSA